MSLVYSAEQLACLQAGLVECFDVAIPQAMPWTGSFAEKALHAAKILPQHLRGLNRLHAARIAEIAELKGEIVRLKNAADPPVTSTLDQAEAIARIERSVPIRGLVTKEIDGEHFLKRFSIDGGEEIWVKIMPEDV